MGHYTTLARLASLAAKNSHQRARRVGGTQERRRGPDGPAAYVCPHCGDESVAPSDCTRCRVAFVSTADHVLVPRATERHSLPPGAVVRASLWVVGSFTSQGALKLRERRRFRKVRRRVSASAPLDIAALPAEASAPVHVRGRVCFVEADVHGHRVGVVDATGLVLIALGSQLSVYDARGERFAIQDGRTVDVLGVGRREVRPGGTYRDAGGVFVLDGEAGVDVWIHDAD